MPATRTTRSASRKLANPATHDAPPQASTSPHTGNDKAAGGRTNGATTTQRRAKPYQRARPKKAAGTKSDARPRTARQERERRFREDEMVHKAHAHAVVCGRCRSTIKLDKKSDFVWSHWAGHRASCLRLSEELVAMKRESNNLPKKEEVPQEGKGLASRGRLHAPPADQVLQPPVHVHGHGDAPGAVAATDVSDRDRFRLVPARWEEDSDPESFGASDD
ncbi:hypothetical protein BD413DRAFT_609558 [Trametes elegans]|nr:hypothetical protein BD413DRAFT_609558 [Trametes elegans]